MKILLFGVSCVGKTTIGKLLAKELKYKFIDLDNIIKEKYNTMDKFNEEYPWDYTHHKIKGQFLEKVVKEDNIVVAVSVINYSRFFNKMLKEANIIAFELTDTVENIFNRLQFYDEFDDLYEDSLQYKEKHKEHYLTDIKKDIKYYRTVFKKIENKYKIDGQSPEYVAKQLYEIIKEWC